MFGKIIESLGDFDTLRLEDWTELDVIKRGIFVTDPVVMGYAIARVEDGDYSLIDLKKAWFEGLVVYALSEGVDMEVRDVLDDDKDKLEKKEKFYDELMRLLASGEEFAYIETLIVPASEPLGDF